MKKKDSSNLLGELICKRANFRQENPFCKRTYQTGPVWLRQMLGLPAAWPNDARLSCLPLKKKRWSCPRLDFTSSSVFDLRQIDREERQYPILLLLRSDRPRVSGELLRSDRPRVSSDHGSPPSSPAPFALLCRGGCCYFGEP
jgi:hypothetical protein